MWTRTSSSSSKASSSSARSGCSGAGADGGRWLYAAVLLAALALSAAGCGRAKSGKHLIGFSQCNLGEPWRVAMNAEVAARAKDFPDLEIAFADAQQDHAKQVADVENF